jgi:succinate dehydrogenase / fumarate reductase, flavoprotein subunit
MFSLKIAHEREVDVLIVGAGAAGIRTAISLHHHHISSLIVSKREFGDAHTWFASGGINASLGSLDPEDGWQIHAADTLREGHFINDTMAVETVCKFAPEAIRELKEWGCDFNLTEDGKIDQRFFGAQSFRRTCFVGDKTGRAILDTLIRKAKELNLEVLDGIFIFHLLKGNGNIHGALGVDRKTQEITLFKTSHVVLAAGGHASIYSRSSSRPDENLGDAVFLAYEAGAELMDMEMVQFHPTGMVKPEGYEGKLVTEAVRGEGGYLLNKNLERFMSSYSPEMMELDARDEVARAIFKEIQQGRGTENGGVLLDISHVDADSVRSRLPKMYERFYGLGIDITTAPMEVSPTSHYSMGGIVVDFESGATNVPGLFAVGEATGGLHGANRLGGNSLIETVVMGKLCGNAIAESFKSMREFKLEGDSALEEAFRCRTWHSSPLEVINEIKELMWHHAGIVKTEDLLTQGKQKLNLIAEKCRSELPEYLDFDAFWNNLDLMHVLLTSDMVIQASNFRKESRGAHFREDYQEMHDSWHTNIICSKGEYGITLATRKPGQISSKIKEVLEENHTLNYHQLE